MNVRFSYQSVRCRVKRAELEGLLAGRAISLEVALPRDHVFRVNVRPSPLAEWKLESDREQAPVEEHLATCASCVDELAVYRDVVGTLPLALSPATPPAAAW